jgi:hypothetical protein
MRKGRLLVRSGSRVTIRHAPLHSPHVEQPHVEQPHVEQPHVEQPHVEQPHVEQPHVDLAPRASSSPPGRILGPRFMRMKISSLGRYRSPRRRVLGKKSRAYLHLAWAGEVDS